MLLQLGSDGVYLEFPEGTPEHVPGAKVVLLFRRLKSWMDSGHRLYCSDANLGDIVLEMQDEKDAAPVARMMMTLALRLRDAEAQSNSTGPDAQTEDAQEEMTHTRCSAEHSAVVPLPNDTVGELPTSSTIRSRRRAADALPVDIDHEEGGAPMHLAINNHVRSPTVAPTVVSA